ncbi:WD repeat-containing protein 89-like isoform X1 [Octopus vulgaris]|uniref:WD repeat-containing protein 89 n=1 Tax=Octopus vulgaris TaxID=6645 RepID=A0AA36AZ23_OCTVU|nr:WD repeat-containing protein 89-like isoform X1 [Octopus vulgaris]
MMESMEDMMRKLNFCEKTAISLKPVEEEYILHMDIQQSADTPDSATDDRLLACSSSSYNIRLHARHNMATLQQIDAHKNVISGIKFAHNDTHLLFSSSWDGSIRCWDIRTDFKKPAQEFAGCDKCLLCLDINSSDSKIAAGTESVEKEVELKIWDRRQNVLLTDFTDSHMDDITQVSFHPTNENLLASGSTDGLVCKFDLAEDTEENSLLLTMNSLSSVAFVGWCSPNYDQIYCTTHVDTFHVWDSTEGDLLYQMTNVKEKLKDKVEYIVDYIGSEKTDHWMVLAGQKNGNLSILEFSNDKDVEIISSLSGGHTGIIRCLHWDKMTSSLVTGGEDSMVCLWSTTTAEENKESNKLKIKAHKPKNFAPY